jgi:hypothetical protein
MSPVRFPDKTLTAIGSGRQINLQNLGVPTVLIFHYRGTAGVARNLNNIIREKYPASQVLVASVLDLHSIPKLARGATETMIKREYKNAADELKEDQTPEDYVILIADWNGGITKSLGFKKTDKQAGLAVFDSSGYLIDKYQGDGPEDVVFSFLDQAMG